MSGGSKLAKITDGAVSFDGSGDYLRIAATSDFDQSPGTDFTVEAYIYMDRHLDHLISWDFKLMEIIDVVSILLMVQPH